MINNMFITAVPLLLGHLFLCNAGDKPGQSKDVCSPALVDPSPIQHQWAEDGLEVKTLENSLRIKNFLGFYDCLFLLLHSQQSQGRHVLVKGLKIMTLLSLVKNQHLRCARTILTSGCGWGTTPIMTAPI